jgi:hypothetical protein
MGRSPRKKAIIASMHVAQRPSHTVHGGMFPEKTEAIGLVLKGLELIFFI